MTLKEIKDYIVARIFNNDAQKITGSVLQDTLTTMADSMSTPSGDPMHYAYEAAGAVWNDSSNFWKLSGIYDLTNENMRHILNLGFMRDGIFHFLASPEQKARVNLPRMGLANTLPMDLYCYAQYNTYIECINFTQYAQTIYYESIIQTSDSRYAFNGCSNLKTIYGRLQPTNCIMMFGGCEALERVKIEGLSESISFEDSPNLLNEYILYMISNSAATRTITITLHPTAYARAVADSQIKSVLASITNVKLASA